jgi:hypothetical protein
MKLTTHLRIVSRFLPSLSRALYGVVINRGVISIQTLFYIKMKFNCIGFMQKGLIYNNSLYDKNINLTNIYDTFEPFLSMVNILRNTRFLYSVDCQR